jgi:DNA-3-methyladenine glycosylase II
MPLHHRVIAAHPRVALKTRGDPFVTLARSITGQQISVKAADAVWQRFCAACGDLTPRSILRRRATTLRACGLSDRKVEYIRDLASHFVSGHIEPARFADQDDEAIIAELVAVRGIGRWTAEMFLMFRLGRPDVLPAEDYGIRKGFATVYKKRELPLRKQLEKHGERWKPYRSVASWYLWRALELEKK